MFLKQSNAQIVKNWGRLVLTARTVNL